MPFLILIVLALLAGTAAAAAAARYPDPLESAGDEVADEAADRPRLRVWLRNRRDPAEATGLLLSLALLLLLGGGLLLAALAYLVRSNDAVLDVDASAARWGHDHASHLSNRLLQLVTDLGDTVGATIAVLVVLAIEWRRRHGGLRLVVPFLAVAIAGDELVTTGIKELVDRARPTLNPIAKTLGPSFPSGHSSTAACVYASLALVLARGSGPRTRTLLAAGAVGIGVAVAASRVLLDVHWLSDVMGGLALGWAWFALCAVAFGGRLLRFGAPVEQAVEAGSRRSRPPGGPVQGSTPREV